MISLWLAAGLLSGQAPAITIRRGDDAGARERFWRKQAEEWLEARLGEAQRATTAPARARRRVANRIVADVPVFVSALPEFDARVDALGVIAERLLAPSVDYSALAAQVAMEMEFVANWQRQQRRRRDIDALLVLAA